MCTQVLALLDSLVLGDLVGGIDLILDFYTRTNNPGMKILLDIR